VSNDPECTGPAYRYLGCYDDATGPFLGRTLPQGLDGRTGVAVEECSAAARSRGFPLFALQGKGQCFLGSMADIARIQAYGKLADAACNDLPCPASAVTCPVTRHYQHSLRPTWYAHACGVLPTA
jgi:hypothetical protein